MLDFNLENVSFGRESNDLVIEFDDGGHISVNDFFVTDGAELPPIVLEDGTEIAGTEFLAAVNADIDLTPAGEALSGSGISSYSDNAGDLIGGMEGLESLGTNQWSNAAASTENLFVSGTASPVLPDSEAPSMPDDPGESITPPQGEYQVRAVLYGPDSNKVQFRLVDANSNALDGSNFDPANISFADDGNGYFILPPSYDAEDNIFSLELSQEAKDALLADPSSQLSTIITITVDGRTYNMQVVVNPDGSFSSADEDMASNNGVGVGAEWHTGENPEASSGHKDGAREGDNETWFEEFSGSFTSGRGDDKVNVSGDIKAETSHNTISTGGGDDTVNVDGNIFAQNGKNNTISMGDGNNAVNISQNAQANGLGSSNIITAKGGDDNVTIGGALSASAGGFNSVSLGDGENTLTVEGSIRTSAGSTVSISTGAGKDTVNITKNINTQSGSSSTIDLGAGADDTLNVDGYVFANGNGAINTINTEGSITIGGSASADDTLNVGSYVFANGNGAINTINTEGSITIGGSASADEGGQNQLSSGGAFVINNGVSTLNGSTQNVSSDASLTVNGQVGSRRNSSTELTAKDIAVNAGSSDSAIISTLGSSTTLTAEGKVEIIGGESALSSLSNPEDDSSITINADNIHLKANKNAMNAGLGGKNTIESHAGEAIKVTITVEAGEGKNLFAMHAQSSGQNKIIGHSDGSNGTSDNIEITGDIYASENGKNIISTGSGNDYISVTGDFSVRNGKPGENIIETGLGNDTVHLNGKISSGGLTLDMGEGYDTLILTAGSVAEFKENYDAWLNSDGFKNANIENVHIDINGAIESDLQGLMDYLNGSSAFDGIDITYTIGSTMHLDQAGVESLDLGSLFSQHDHAGIEELNLNNGNGDSITIDSSIFENMDINGLKISGDANDVITLDGNWSHGDTVDGYVTYTSGENSIHVQENRLEQLIVSGGL